MKEPVRCYNVFKGESHTHAHTCMHARVHPGRLVKVNL